MKTCSNLLIIREKQKIAALKYNFLPSRLAKILKNVLYWARFKENTTLPHCWQGIKQYLTNLHIDLHSNLAIQFLGIHCTSMFNSHLSNPTCMNLPLKILRAQR